jgi:hypothetical protein
MPNDVKRRVGHLINVPIIEKTLLNIVKIFTPVKAPVGVDSYDYASEIIGKVTNHLLMMNGYDSEDDDDYYDIWEMLFEVIADKYFDIVKSYYDDVRRLDESKLTDLLRDRFKVDLTNKIDMVTNKWELPMEFDNFVHPNMLNRYLNKWGPMFIITNKNNKYLCQMREKEWAIVDEKDTLISELEFMKILGIEHLGLSLNYLIDAYFKEDINESLSRQDEYKIKWNKFEKFMKRRSEEIKELISQHTHAYKYDIGRYDEDNIVTSVLEMAGNDFIMDNDLNDEDSIEYDWVQIYIEENYADYVKKELGL